MVRGHYERFSPIVHFRRNTKTQILGSVELNGRSVGALVLVISIALEGDSDVEHATFALFFCSEEIGTVAAAVHLLAGSETWLHRQLV